MFHVQDFVTVMQLLSLGVLLEKFVWIVAGDWLGLVEELAESMMYIGVVWAVANRLLTGMVTVNIVRYCFAHWSTVDVEIAEPIQSDQL